MLVFVAAEIRELHGWLRHLSNVEHQQWPVQYAASARWKETPVILAANGPGPRLAGEAADAAHENVTIDALISTGFCGGLTPKLRLNEIFVATSVNGSVTCRPQTRLPHAEGALVSQNRVAITATEKAALREGGGDAVEMEASAIAERGACWRVPFYCVRVVTDTAKETFPIDFNAFRDPEGRFSRARIALAALKKPRTLVPELWRLERRSKEAATILGDFLADCRF